MSKTTIIRKIDELGRIVLPKDIRKSLNIHTGDLLELKTDAETLSISKYSSIQDIRYLATLLLDTVYEQYHIEGILVENDNIISIPGAVSKKKIEEKQMLGEKIVEHIVVDERTVGDFIFFVSSEKGKELLSFLTLFLKKYLEES